MNYFCYEKDQFARWTGHLYRNEHPDVLRPLNSESKHTRSTVWPVEESMTLSDAIIAHPAPQKPKEE